MHDDIDWDSMYVPDTGDGMPLRAMVEKIGDHPQMDGWIYVKSFPDGEEEIAVPESRYQNVGEIMDETGGEVPAIRMIETDELTEE